MPIKVVGLLQPIDIEEDDADLGLLILLEFDPALIEPSAVRKASQCIGGRRLAELFFLNEIPRFKIEEAERSGPRNQ